MGGEEPPEGALDRLLALSPESRIDEKSLVGLLNQQYECDDDVSLDSAAKRLLRAVNKNDESDCTVAGSLQRFLDDRGKELDTEFKANFGPKDAIDEESFVASLLKHGVSSERSEALWNAIDRKKEGIVSVEEFKRQLLLRPPGDGQWWDEAYDFLVDELELDSESDVLISQDGGHGFGYFWAGGCAGVISRTCTAPFDRLKVYLIAASAGRPHGIPIMVAIKNIYSNGGVRSFFVGNGLNAFKVFPESAIKFGSFESAKRMLTYFEGVDDPAELSRAATFLAGGLGGMCSQLCVYPIDTLKFRVQCESFTTNLKGHTLLYHTIQQMWSSGGIRSFYRGLYVGVLGVFPFAALDLGMFSALRSAYIRRQSLNNNINPQDVQMGNLIVLSMGALSGSIGATVVYPINLVRTRIQTQNTASHPYSYTGFLDCMRKTKAREGWRGFFRGLGPNLAKVAPSVSISYLVYEHAKHLLGLR